MRLRRDSLLALALLLLCTAVGLLARLTVGETGLLYVAPALLMLLPLAVGRYVGEERLTALRAAPGRARRRGARVAPAPAGVVRLMERGGRLVASSLAKRPPPSPLRLAPA